MAKQPFLDKLAIDRENLKKQISVVGKQGAAFAPAPAPTQVTQIATLKPGQYSAFGYRPQDPRNADQPNRLPAPDAAGGGGLRPNSPATPSYEIPNSSELARLVPPDLAESISRLRGTTFASILCQPEPPVTNVGSYLIGSQVETASPAFLRAFKNSLPYPIAVAVTFDPGSNTGVAVNVSLTTDQSGKDSIWTLSSGGLLKSGGILMSQDQTIYIRKDPASLALTDEEIRVLVFDPVAFFGSSILP